MRPYEPRLPYMGYLCWICYEGLIKHGWLEQSKQYKLICPGDFIIKDVDGTFTSCKPEAFNKEYERVE